MGCIALVRCVLVIRCGLAVVVWYPYAGWGTSASACIRIPHHHSQTTTYHQHTSNLSTSATSASACIRIPHHHSQTTTYHQHTSNQSNTTHEITQQISRKLLRVDVLTSETCWALNNEIIKQVTSSWSFFIQQYTQLSVYCLHCSIVKFPEADHLDVPLRESVSCPFACAVNASPLTI